MCVDVYGMQSLQFSNDRVCMWPGWLQSISIERKCILFYCLPADLNDADRQRRFIPVPLCYRYRERWNTNTSFYNNNNRTHLKINRYQFGETHSIARMDLLKRWIWRWGHAVVVVVIDTYVQLQIDWLFGGQFKIWLSMINVISNQAKSLRLI